MAGQRAGSSPDAPSRARLSRDQVAVAALEYLDRHGLEGLSMRRLANELGVGTMTLYGYFRSKQELLDAVVDAAMTETPVVSATGEWRPQVRELVYMAWHNLSLHPSLVQIRVQQPVLRPEALRFAEAGMRILQAAGFDKREAAQAFRLLFTYTFGFAAFSPQHAADEARTQARAAMRALPPEDYPMLSDAAAAASEAMAGEEQFRFGLERILDGLEAALSMRDEDG